MAISFSERTLTYSELRDAALRVAGCAGGRPARCGAGRTATRDVRGGDRRPARGCADRPDEPQVRRARARRTSPPTRRPRPSCARPGATVPAAFAGRSWLTVDLDDERPPSAHPVRHPAEHPALIVYTSGTTGTAEGSGPSAACDRLKPRRARRRLGLDRATTRSPTALPLFHVHGLVIGILGPIRRGGTAVHVGSFSPEAVRER